MYIGIDFDGTVVTHRYPKVGDDIGAVPVLKELVENGHDLILFTMRDSRNGTLQDAVEWFKENGIPLYGVNRNPTQGWTDSPKAYCQLYIDDAAFGCPTLPDPVSRGRRYVDWEKIEEMLKEEGIIYDEDEENMKSTVKINESQLREMVAKSIKNVLKESIGTDIDSEFGGKAEYSDFYSYGDTVSVKVPTQDAELRARLIKFMGQQGYSPSNSGQLDGGAKTIIDFRKA